MPGGRRSQAWLRRDGERRERREAAGREALRRGRVMSGKHMGKRPRWVVHSKEAGPWAGRAIVISLDACEVRCTGTARGCAARPMGGCHG